MNRHFRDSVYYLKRAGEEAKNGVEMEAKPLREQLAGVRERYGDGEEIEDDRTERAKAVVGDIGKQVRAETEQAIEAGRERLVRDEQAN